ncbi:MAG: HDIG domain-containing protein, partial [Victivallales bacterium]|nr:HDIG domain-containing protein [Victivallales bacterium]
GLAAERIRDELTLIFTGPAPAAGLDLLSATGLLAVLLPEVAALRGVSQPPQFHPEGDVYTHTRLMLKAMALPDAATAWSVLLHDIGKPQTRFVDPDGRIRFFWHDSRGAEMAAEVMARLRFSRRLSDQVIQAVKNHMRIAHAPEMRREKIRRFLADGNFPLELELHRLDCISSHAQMDIFCFLLDKVNEQSGEIKLPPPLLTGNDLIAMGYKPGPRFRKILDRVADLQLQNNLKTPEEAQAFVRDKFKKTNI